MGTFSRTSSNYRTSVSDTFNKNKLYKMKFLLCLTLLGVALSSVSSRSYYQGPRSRNTRSDPLLELDQEIQGPAAPIGDGRGCTGLCYIMKLERLARELGLRDTKDKRFDGYLY